MDAVKFTKEAARMCLSHKSSCGACGAWDSNDCVCKIDYFDNHFDPEESVRIVEEWSKAHPIQTNREKLKEVFGFYFNRNRYGSGCVRSDCIGGGCENCQYGDDWWWDMPYEAPKGER